MERSEEKGIKSEMNQSSVDSAIRRLNIGYYVGLIFGLGNFVLECYLNGVFTFSEDKFWMIFGYGSLVFFNKWINKNTDFAIFFSFLYGETINLLLIYFSFLREPECAIVWSQLSPLVIIYYQGYLLETVFQMILISLKHTLLWTLSSYYFSSIKIRSLHVTFSGIIGGFVLLLLCFYLDHLQSLDLCTSKEKIKTANKKLQSLIEAIPQCISVVTEKFSTLFTNSTLNEILLNEKLIDYLQSKIYYLRYSQDFAGKNISEDIKNSFGFALNTYIVYGITENKGTLIEWSGKIDTWENSKVLILYGKNVSDLIRLEKESLENRYKSMLLRTVSHELRTPTNAMLVMAECLLESKDLSQENLEKVKIMSSSCGYLLCLINDLLDYAQIMAGCLKTLKISFNLPKLLNECCSIFDLELKKSSIALSVMFLNKIPEDLISDPFRLKQIIINLLSNAKKFTKKGSIVLEVLFESPKLIISCRDSGTGIDDSKISSLFTAFSKIENNSLNPQGVGLGLYISNMLVHELGGSDIRVTSKIGKGSTFTFEILVEISNSENYSGSEVAEENVKVSVPSTNSARLLDQRKILIVDDTYFNILAYLHVLKAEGFFCEYVMDGKDAIHKVKSQKYHCIIMDIEMPVMDGWETTNALKKMSDSKEIEELPPIIGATAHDLQGVKEKCISVGMSDVILKPCPKDEIVCKINFWIDAFRN